jgi:hypothetical protein
MFDYRFTDVAPHFHGAILAYSVAPRTIPILVSRFTNPGPPVQNGTPPRILPQQQATSVYLG